MVQICGYGSEDSNARSQAAGENQRLTTETVKNQVSVKISRAQKGHRTVSTMSFIFLIFLQF